MASGQYMWVSLVSNSNEAIRTILPRIKDIHAAVSASAKAGLVPGAQQHLRDGSTSRPILLTAQSHDTEREDMHMFDCHVRTS